MDASRRAEVEARRAEVTAAADPRENVRSFLSGFELDRAKIEDALLAATAAPKSNPPDDSTGDPVQEKRIVLETLRDQVSEMERKVAEASYFLPPFDARNCATTIETVRSTLADATGRLAPRKKFEFKRFKKKKTKTDAETPVAATGAETREDTRDTRGGSASRSKNDSETFLAQMGVRSVGLESSGFTDAAGKRFAFRGTVPSKVRPDPNASETAPAATTESRVVNDVVLERLTDCEVFLLAPCRALRIYDLENCRVYGGPVDGSVHAQNLKNCHVEVCARQVRAHDAFDTSFYVRTLSRPIIEHSSRTMFAPFSFSYEGQSEHLRAAGLSVETGAWENVEDFGWIKQTPSPNWSVVPEEARKKPPREPEGCDCE
jgi:hypothetical protein